jgi:hypothetical protein
MSGNNELANLITIFKNTCDELKTIIDKSKIYDTEFRITTKIKSNYKFIGNFYEFVVYIESTELVSRLYTDLYNNNYSIHIKPFIIENNTLFSYIKIIDNKCDIVYEEKFIY